MTRLIPPPPPRGAVTPAVALARDAFGREIVDGSGSSDPGRQDGALPQAAPAGGGVSDAPGASAPPKEKATDAIGRRAAALADAIDFPTFVASLVHGTYDAIVDSSIKQVESFADLVGAVAKPLDQFTQENVTDGQARAWLVEQYPHDVTLVQDGGEYRLAPVARPGNDDDTTPAPAWLTDFGAADGAFDTQTLESVVLPRARERVAQHRLSTLSTMVLLGMQRVVVKDGTIAASLNFQAKARDRAAVQYATSNDPSSGQTTWGGRGTSGDVVTTVSTVAVNAQTDTDLKATLTGKVSINFASETLPLDRFVDEASRNLLERHSRPAARIAPPAATGAQPAAPVAAPASVATHVPAAVPAVPAVPASSAAPVTPAAPAAPVSARGEPT
ncbi:hypothetical protein [Burkholderia sp. Bp9004]|uniref:hypothetical protein n=1 Tax=Burkholderia sp. Bp9004 TaxID=2184559 RepID=UPI0016395C39|nr:hypothetical protein [Burkholderia sp. Bp9004]